jgi:pyruvate formate lyase activating enzyme
MKGCPLACQWCHNPEGQSLEPQWMQGQAQGQTGKRLAGREFSADELANLLNRQGSILKANEGGVTFSGGEPLYQAEFLLEVIGRLDGLHVLLDTSGYGREEDFHALLEVVDQVYYDIKLVDPAAHLHYTGCSNERILSNAKVLSQSGKPFVIRVPLIPGVTDTDDNLAGIASLSQELLNDSGGLLRVDLLPYNRAAGAKYEAVGRRFQTDYNENQPVNANTEIFRKKGIKVTVA